jgi:hypothetical protein
VAREIMGHLVVKDAILGSMERFADIDGGFVWGALQAYSEDISLAESIIDKLSEQVHQDIKHLVNSENGEYTEAEAICKAALLVALKRYRTTRLIRQALGEPEEEG